MAYATCSETKGNIKMSFVKVRTSIADACAPATGSTKINSHKPIWSLTQMGSGMSGQDARTLSCIFDRQTDEQGNFQGEMPYPVIGKIQAYPAISALQRTVEWRIGITLDQVTGLLYRKLPSPNGFGNSWLTSGEIAMQSWVGNWGRITSDRHAGVYRFEALKLSGRTRPNFPDIDDLIDELLAEYVIDRLDHPVLARLLPQTSTPPLTSSTQGAEDDTDDVY
jgi:hypothetical protein